MHTRLNPICKVTIKPGTQSLQWLQHRLNSYSIRSLIIMHTNTENKAKSQFLGYETVNSLHMQGSQKLFTFGQANCLLKIPKDTSYLAIQSNSCKKIILQTFLTRLLQDFSYLATKTSLLVQDLQGLVQDLTSLKSCRENPCTIWVFLARRFLLGMYTDDYTLATYITTLCY